MEQIREVSPNLSVPYWQHNATPDNIRNLLTGRLNRLGLQLLDVHDVKDLLQLRSLRFAERLFTLIDIRCTGFVSVDDLVDFVYSFETNNLQFRFYMIFHCYDATSRGYLSIPEIKTMFRENFVEGGCEMEHHAVECLMERVLSQIGAQGSFLSYPHLLEIAMHHPQFVCHLVKSKLPTKSELSLFEAGCRCLRDIAIDHSGRLLSASLLFFVSVTVFVAGSERHSKDELAEVLGWTHTVGRSTSDLFKVLIAFLTLTLCRLTPFLYRKLPRTMHVSIEDLRIFRSIVLVIMLFVVLVHSICQTLNMGRLSVSDVLLDQSSVFYRRARPSIHTLLRSNVFISGFLLFVIFAITVIFAVLQNYDWSFRSSQLAKLRLLFYGNGWFKALVLFIFVALTATHSSTTFVRSCFRLPCLFWLWLGFPVLALFLDYVIFKLVDPISEVDVVDFRILPEKGLILVLSKPVDCRLGALSFVSLSFPSTHMSGQRSFPVLSHPSENSLMVLIRAIDLWSRELLQYLLSHDEKSVTPAARDSGDSAAVEVGDTGYVRDLQQTEDQISPNRPHCHIPDRLTRLNTRLVYLTQSQRIAGMIGDDPHARNAAVRREASEPTEHVVPRRNTSSNFNVIFEITPASLSTGDSLRREEQRVGSRQVTDETLVAPVSSPLLSESRSSGIHVDLRTFLRGPYKLNNAFQEEKLLLMLSYPVLFLIGDNFSSLPLIPLCSYLLRRKPMGQRDRSQGVITRKMVLSWEINGFDDVLWLLELIEPLYDLRSLILFEVHLHIHYCPRAAFSSALFYDCLARIVRDPFVPKFIFDTRVSLNFGKPDWEYQLEILKEDVFDDRVGVMVDGSQSTHRQVYSWIQANAVDQFDLLSVGIISI